MARSPTTWSKGQTGNPYGASRYSPEVIKAQALAQGFCPEAMHILMAIARDKLMDGEGMRQGCSVAMRKAAALALVERGAGKVAQAIEVIGHDDLDSLPLEERVRIMEAGAAQLRLELETETAVAGAKGTGAGSN